MNPEDIAGLIHPALAVAFVFPLIGIVVHYAWQTRQRRLQAKENGKSKIPPTVGSEHVKLGRWLSNSVVGLALIGLAHPLFTKMAKDQVWTQNTFRAWFVVLMFGVTVASLIILNRAITKLWRAVFATLTGMGLVILGCQPEIFRRTYEWQVSHYYYGMTAALLMIFSLAIITEIYKDRTNRWRTVHIILNCVAVLLFVGQGMTGTRDLLEIPLGWQESHLYKCDYANKTCPP
jgi:hypothetical protein